MNTFADKGWNTFVPYSGLHVLTVCVCALLIAALAAAGRKMRASETAMRWALGIFALIYWLSYNIWWNRHGLELASGLPRRWRQRSAT